jgi:hypothetical protein
MTRRLLTGFALIFCLFWPVAVSAQADRAQGENLLHNGDFEVWPETYQADGQVATGWSPFVMGESGSQPVLFRATTAEWAVSGAAQQWASNGFAGLYQTVAVTPDTTVRLSAWTNAWSSDSDRELTNPAWVRQRVGIDPYGGTDPTSATIVWSMPGNFVNRWGELSVETRTVGQQVTVFLAAHPNVVRAHNQIVYDNARLTAVAFSLPAVASSGPTPVPTSDPLLDGLVVGSGILPGQQGISSHSYRGEADAGPAEPASNWLEPFVIILAVALLAIAITHPYRLWRSL